jgi:hypothetical protein
MHTGSGCSQGGNGPKTDFPFPRSKYQILSPVGYLRGFCCIWREREFREKEGQC